LEIKLTSKFYLPLLIVSGVLFITILMPWVSVSYGIFDWEIVTLIAALVSIELAFVTSPNLRAMGSLIAGALAVFGVILAWAVDIRSFWGFGIILSLLASIGLLGVGLMDYMTQKQPAQGGQPYPQGQAGGRPAQPGQPVQAAGPLHLEYIEPIKLALLCIVTFGIYALLWYINTSNKLTAYGAKILPVWYLFIPGLNIYWMWVFSEALEYVTSKRIEGMTAFLMMGFLGVIGIAIVQDNINKLVAPPAAPVYPAGQPNQPPRYQPPAPPPSGSSAPPPPPPPPPRQ
jgi:hypothetical protein